MSLPDTARAAAKNIARAARDEVRLRDALRRLRAANPDAYVSPGVKFTGDATRTHLAAGASVHGPTVIVCADGGGLHGSRLEVGERTYIGELNNIRTAGAPIVIGRDCLISQHITMVGSNHGTRLGTTIVDQPWDGDGIVIGDGVWIGANVTILPGTRIGDGAVVAAGAVVRGEVAPNTIVGGAPARVISERR